eukprot:tig00020660_g12521.t1
MKHLEAKNKELEEEYARHTAMLERQLKSEAVLRDISRSIRTELRFCDVARANLRPIMQLFDSDSVMVSALRCGQGRCNPADAIATKAELQHRIATQLARPGVVRFERDWMRFVEDVDAGGPARDENDEAFKQLQKEVAALGFNACIMKATEWNGQVTGLVAMGWSRALDPSPHERGLFSAVCDLLGHSAQWWAGETPGPDGLASAPVVAFLDKMKMRTALHSPTR